MHHLKLISLLKLLSGDEMLRFGKFLRSPFFNYTKNQISFYEQLKKYHPAFDSKKLKAEKIWLKVFPDQPFNQKKMTRLCSDMNLLLERYLIELELEQPNRKKQQLLIQSFERRHAYPFFEKEIRKALTNLEKQPVRDADYFKEKSELYEQWYFHPFKNKFDKKDRTLIELSDSLDACFLLQKFKLGIAQISFQKLFQQDYEIRYLSLLEENSNGFFLNENIHYQLYKHSFDLLQKGKDSDFETVEKLLFKHLDSLKKTDAKLFFINGLNFAFRKLNRGEKDYGEVVLRWYIKGIEEEIILDNGFLSEVTFQNFIQTSCYLKDFDLAKKFIEQYQSFLRTETRKYSTEYGWAIYFFERGDFDEAIHILLNTDWTKTYLLHGKNLLIRAYFERYLKNKDYYYLLLDTLKNFEIFALRTKLYPKTHLEPHLNLVRILKKLANRINGHKSSEEITDWLKIQLKKGKKVIFRGWLENLVFT